ncbi:diphthine--ammonia ligase [Hymenobacter fodinae]|uniref:Diphthine--ammonia ligase n=2 Tax=Hymenobacter fodinae TaxID=2510796 RepID=A0A4Z0PEH2_9BACT|nr:diphthine--ammonia ligase [Hymenobacter fodinae]
MNWSGGKDSALALYHALRNPQLHVKALLTSVNTHYQRVSMHGVRLELLEAQAQRIGLPLTQLRLPEMPDMAEYEAQMRATLAPLQEQGITHSVFGDIYLEDLRQYREQQLARVGMQAVFPLWQRPNAELLREYLALGFRAVVVCVNDRYLDQSFCGRLLDEDFLRDLPAGVDSCGENGEYHSFVFDAPYFSSPIPFERGELVRRTYQAPATRQNSTPTSTYGTEASTSASPFAAGFWYTDLHLA